MVVFSLSEHHKPGMMSTTVHLLLGAAGKGKRAASDHLLTNSHQHTYQYLRQGPFLLDVHSHNCLIGLDVTQHITWLDGLPLLFHPLDNCALRHGG